jgi:hypothetical protein
MRNFSQDQGNQGIARPAYRRREQANPQIDADIAEKGHFWLETKKRIKGFIQSQGKQAATRHSDFSRYMLINDYIPVLSKPMHTDFNPI